MYDTAFECLVIPAVEYLGIPAVESPKDPVSVSHEYEAASVGQCEHHFLSVRDMLSRKKGFKSWTILEVI